MAWYGGSYGRDQNGSPHEFPRPDRRLRVDECAWTLSVDEFRRKFMAVGLRDRVAYNAFWRDGQPRLEVTDYTLPFDRTLLKRKEFASRVRLRSSPCPLYTKAPRWFFVCDGCQRQCRFLYAPQIGDWFRCRTCHELTYASAQVWDTLARRGRLPGLLGRLMVEVMEARDPAPVRQRSTRRRDR